MSTPIQTSANTAKYIALEDQFGAHNYHPVPVVLEKGEGIFYTMWMVKDTLIF
jgi:ornithine--oxo-acid transaminase